VTIIEKALEIALLAHKGQVDKAGKPYILHPLRIMAKMDTEEEMAIALLHDAIEDGGEEISTLIFATMPHSVDSAIRYLTHYDEPYEEYIGFISENELARKVKLADLEDNMNILRLKVVTEKDLIRLTKYHTAWQTLRAARFPT
jgi:(p)ppGpp synthase/HD superfamily hydrolase